MADQAEEVDLTITVDGEKFTMDDLTFRERKELRKLARELDGNDDVELGEVMFDDLVLAFATVCQRRSVPDFSLEDALDIKAGDLLRPAVESEPAKRPSAARTKQPASK